MTGRSFKSQNTDRAYSTEPKGKEKTAAFTGSRGKCGPDSSGVAEKHPQKHGGTSATVERLGS